MSKTLPFVQFCDDIRQEMNGKYILIGCYGGVMTLSAFPFVTRLCAFITAELSSHSADVRVVYKLRSGAKIGELSFSVEAPEDSGGNLERGQIPLPGIPISLSSPDEISISWSVGGGPLEEIGSLRVEQVVTAG